MGNKLYPQRFGKFQRLFLEELGFRKRTMEERRAGGYEYSWAILDNVYLLKTDEGYFMKFNLSKGETYRSAYSLKHVSVLLAVVPRLAMLEQTTDWPTIQGANR